MQLTDGAVYDSQPVLSPDRKRVAFVRNGGVYTVKIDGSDLTRETTNGSSPGWIPDSSAVSFSRGSALRILPLGSTDNDGAYLGSGNNLQWGPDRSRYFYSRNGALLTKYAFWGSEQVVSIAGGATWTVSPDGSAAYAVEREGHDPSQPNGPARIIRVDVSARLLAEPNEPEVTPALAASLAEEVLVGNAGSLLAEHCHPDNDPTTDECPNVSEQWVAGDSFGALEVSWDNNKLLYKRTKAASDDHSFVEADYETLRATGLQQVTVSEVWTQGSLIPGSAPPQYEKDFVMQQARWRSDMYILAECLDTVCLYPSDGIGALSAVGLANIDVADARLSH